MKIIILILSVTLLLASCKLYHNNVVFISYSKEKHSNVYPLFMDRYGDYYPIYPLQQFDKRKTLASLRNHYKHYKDTWSSNNNLLYHDNSNNFDSLQTKIIDLNTELINETIKVKHYTSVTFIMVGFNNTYLATKKDTLNANMKLDKLIEFVDSVKPNNNTLFVKLYWDGKYSGNKIGSASNFRYATTNSYYVGFGLRKLIQKLETRNINFISHSLGANIVCEAIFNQENKITNTNHFKDSLQKLHSKTNIFIENKTIKAAIIAPAMPGTNTFIDFFNATLNPKLNKNDVSFFVGWFKDDAALKKFIFPNKLGSTTLGCNYKNETESTRTLFMKNKLATSFNDYDFKDNSIIKGFASHDLLNYLNNKKAYKNVIDFLYE